MPVLREIAQELQGLDQSPRALRRFGWTVGLVLLGVAGILVWRHGGVVSTAAWVVGGAGSGLVLLGTLGPALLRPVYRLWMGLAIVLGYVMTRVILSTLYVVAITPVGWLRRTVSQSPILTRPDEASASYWIPKPDYDPHDRERLERYF